MQNDQDYKNYLETGISKTNEGKFQEALEDLEKAIKLNPNSALGYFSKGIVFHNLSQLQAALENYTKAIEIDPKMIDAYYNRAQSILALDEKSEEELKNALFDLEKAIELDAKFIDALYCAATIKKKLGDYQGALKNLDTILEIEPDAIYSKALKKLILQKYL